MTIQPGLEAAKAEERLINRINLKLRREAGDRAHHPRAHIAIYVEWTCQAPEVRNLKERSASTLSFGPGLPTWDGRLYPRKIDQNCRTRLLLVPATQSSPLWLGDTLLCGLSS